MGGRKYCSRFIKMQSITIDSVAGSPVCVQPVPVRARAHERAYRVATSLRTALFLLTLVAICGQNNIQHYACHSGSCVRIKINLRLPATVGNLPTHFPALGSYPAEQKHCSPLWVGRQSRLQFKVAHSLPVTENQTYHDIRWHFAMKRLDKKRKDCCCCEKNNDPAVETASTEISWRTQPWIELSEIRELYINGEEKMEMP